jgi:NAD(P)H dehydrogenase (quinone)
MKILLVFAHPESRSLNGALRDVAVEELMNQGHEVRISDLYADGWKSEVGHADFPLLPPDARLVPVAASKKAFETGALTEDVRGRSTSCCGPTF